MLKKTKPSVESKFYLLYRLVYISDSMVEFIQLSIRNIVVSSWSKLPLKGTGLCYQLYSFFLIRANGVQMSLWSECCFIVPSWLSQHLSVKNEKRRSKLSLIRPNCVRKHFWSDPSPLEEVMIRPNCARSRLWSDFPDQNYLWSDHLQTMVLTVVRSNFCPDPVILVWEHTGVRSTGSDHKPILGLDLNLVWTVFQVVSLLCLSFSRLMFFIFC